MVKNNFIAEVTFKLPKWPWPLAKWLSICLRPKWLWVWIPLQSVKVHVFVKFSSMFLLKREPSDWKHQGKKWNLKDHKSRKLQRNLNMVGTLKQKLETEQQKTDIKIISQSAFTCSKLTTETLEQGVKYIQS